MDFDFVIAPLERSAFLQFKKFAGKQGARDFLLYNTEISQFDKTFSVGLRYRM